MFYYMMITVDIYTLYIYIYGDNQTDSAKKLRKPISYFDTSHYGIYHELGKQT